MQEMAESLIRKRPNREKLIEQVVQSHMDRALKIRLWDARTVQNCSGKVLEMKNLE
jgi:hypothetical protein